MNINLNAQETKKVTFELLNFSNKKYNDFAPTLYKDGIIFSSNRSKKKEINLYYSNLKDKLIKLNNIDNSYIGPAFYDVKSGILYATRSDRTYRQAASIELYMCIIDNWKIVPAKKLNFKSTLTNFGHADILNGKMIITTSNSNSSKNRLILYKFESFNWVEDEIILSTNNIMVFPKLISDNIIIFSTNIKGGLGGLDLYKITKENGKWSAPINLKEFNSKYDDFSLLYINEYEGYISSNRIDKKDHIFKFTIEH